jgi:hypothetical protein
LEYKIVKIGKDYEGKIDDFADARNSFLSQHDWVLFVDDDEEACDMLLSHHGRYREAWNPDFAPRLVSNKVRFEGRVHEKVVPKDPHGIIDFPLIHNHIGGFDTYKNYWYQDLPVYRVWRGIKKGLEVVRDR